MQKVGLRSLNITLLAEGSADCLWERSWSEMLLSGLLLALGCFRPAFCVCRVCELSQCASKPSAGVSSLGCGHALHKPLWRLAGQAV